MKNKEIYTTLDAQNEAFKLYCSEAVDFCEGRGCLKCVVSWLEAEVKNDSAASDEDDPEASVASSAQQTHGAKQNITRLFRQCQIRDKKVRQHPDGRISIFFSEGSNLHTIYLKSDNLCRSILARQTKKPIEIAPDSLYEWVYWEEV